MFQSLTQPCMCFLGVLFSSLSVYVYEKSCSNHVLWYLILAPWIWQQVPLTPGFISGVDCALSDSASAHGWTGSLLIFFMGINLTSWCRSSPLGAKEVVYCWCPDMDEEISGLCSQHPMVSLWVRQFRWHSVSESHLEFSLSGINIINYWIVISLFEVEGNLSPARASNWNLNEWKSSICSFNPLESGPWGQNRRVGVEGELRKVAVRGQNTWELKSCQFSPVWHVFFKRL